VKQISMPQSDDGIAKIVRDAIAFGEAVTIVEGGHPVLDLAPRGKSWAQFNQTSATERAAAGDAIKKNPGPRPRQAINS
jgi:antitoxin (DNA-binding transcriptional repressor) of toxin-antitoxin stability system